ASRNTIHFLPTQKYRDLVDVYCSADLALFPKQCSMSFFEVQSCSVPILFENNEINAQRAMFGNAITFSAGDLKDFTYQLERIIRMSAGEYQEYRAAARKFI